jgi:hypothetical protein
MVRHVSDPPRVSASNNNNNNNKNNNLYINLRRDQISESAGARLLCSKPSTRCPSNFPANDVNVIDGFIDENQQNTLPNQKPKYFAYEWLGHFFQARSYLIKLENWYKRSILQSAVECTPPIRSIKSVYYYLC